VLTAETATIKQIAKSLSPLQRSVAKVLISHWGYKKKERTSADFYFAPGDRLGDFLS
jgi:hypothetical protein